MRVVIETRNHDGRGRATVGRRVVLVSQAQPGEEVTLHVDRRTSGTLQGRVAKLIRPSGQRNEDPCPHAFRCTGCAFVGANEPAEADFKRERVVDAVAGIPGGRDRVDPVIRPTSDFGYRHYAKQVFQFQRGRVVLGSYVTSTHHVADNRDCPVLVPRLRHLLARLVHHVQEQRLPIYDGKREGLRYAIARHSSFLDEQMLVLVSTAEGLPFRPLVDAVSVDVPSLSSVHEIVQATPSNILLQGVVKRIAGENALREKLGGFEHTIGPTSFFQINPPASEKMIELIRGWVGKGQRCVEGYAGVGAMTLPLSERFVEVHAVERSEEACQSLRENARRYARPWVHVYQGDVGEQLPDLLVPPTDLLVVDPPRRGMGESLARQIAQRHPKRVVVMACDPASLQRDLPPFTAAGYVLHRVVPVDQFPKTAHVEAIAMLQYEPQAACS